MATVSRLVPYAWHFRRRNLDGFSLGATRNGYTTAFPCLVRRCMPRSWLRAHRRNVTEPVVARKRPCEPRLHSG